MHQRFFSVGVIALSGIVLALGLQQSNFALGYGYGYGYGVCTANRPRELSAEYVNNNRRIQFSWEAVTFEDCTDATAAAYRIQVRESDSTLVSEYTDLVNAYKKVAVSSLRTNKPYKFRVKATASDTETTEWSLYKSFRTLPKKPVDLTISSINNGSAYIDWDNVPRSGHLRYYHMVVKRGSRVVFSKRVSLGLNNSRTGAIVEGLKSDARYRVKVRAVARSTSKGEYARKYFTLQ